MTEKNYNPQSTEATETANDTGVLASRWDRLFASILDGIIYCIVIIPIMYFTGGFNGMAQGIQPALGYSLAYGVVGIITFIILNGKLLVSSGQTIGKKAIGIKIVDLNGNLPTLNDHLLKRYAFYFIPGQIPFIGPFISIINILFIFGSEKRCIHDLVAGTKVVDCK
jgi:uncharacterized RDD family membrane protein YckC